MTFINQDLWYGDLVPSSDQRGKPSRTILYTYLHILQHPLVSYMGQLYVQLQVLSRAG